MQSDTLKATDEYSAAKATAPRVSLADMEAKIDHEVYFTISEALESPTLHARYDGLYVHDFDILTICVLHMRNGFTVIGKSAPASPENFDEEKGKRFAYEDAIKQLWPLEGYALREKLSAQ